MCSTYLKLAIVSSLVLASGCTEGPAQSAADHIIRADNYLSESKPREALIELRNAVALDRSSPQVRQRIARVLLAFGDGAGAEIEARKALENGYSASEGSLLLARAQISQLNGTAALASLDAIDQGVLSAEQRIAIQVARGNAYLLEKRVPDAKAAFDEALRADENSADALVGTARVAAASGDFESARAILNRVTAAHPRLASAWMLTGDLARARGEAAAAVEAYTKAIENQFDNRQALLGRGLAHVALGNGKQAREDIRLLRREYREDPAAAFIEGLILLKEKRPSDALGPLQLAASKAADVVDTHLFLALAYAQARQFESARSEVARVLADRPNDKAALTVLAVAQLIGGDLKGATATAHRILQLDPDNTVAHQVAADAALGASDADAAERHLASLIASDLAVARYHYAYGLSLIMKGEHDRGTEALSQAARQDPGNPEIQAGLIRELMRKRDFEGAIKASEELAGRLPDRALPLLLRAGALAAAGRLEEAKAGYEQARDVEPGNAAAARALAIIAWNANQPELAVDHYEKALAHAPNDAELRQSLAEIKLSRGDVAGFLSEIRKAMDVAPEKAGPRILLARFLVNTGRLDEAAKLIDAAPAALAGRPEFIETAGLVYYKAGRLGDAEARFRQLVDAGPAKPQWRLLLAMCLRDLAKYKEAREALQSGLNIDPNNLQMLAILADVEMRSGDASAVNAVLQRVKASDSKGVLFNKLLVRAALARNDPAEALLAQQRILELEPTVANATALAEMYRAAGQVAEALSLLEQWRDRAPSDSALGTMLAGLYEQAGETGRALELYRHVLAAQPNNVVALNNAAWQLLHDKPDEALALAERAHELAPHAASVVDTYGWVLFSTGRTEKAVSILQRAHELDPTSGTLAWHYALALERHGRPERAEEVLVSALRRDFREADEARLLLDRVRAQMGQRNDPSGR
jgi:putative PEP-CTERM system TPR-repeat lipoprotein